MCVTIIIIIIISCYKNPQRHELTRRPPRSVTDKAVAGPPIRSHLVHHLNSHCFSLLEPWIGGSITLCRRGVRSGPHASRPRRHDVTPDDTTNQATPDDPTQVEERAERSWATSYHGAGCPLSQLRWRECNLEYICTVLFLTQFVNRSLRSWLWLTSFWANRIME